jgi:hypothetical protein
MSTFDQSSGGTSFVNAGTPAFFCRLDFLANVRFEQAIEIGTPQEFEDWKATDARGHFSSIPSMRPDLQDHWTLSGPFSIL